MNAMRLASQLGTRVQSKVDKELSSRRILGVWALMASLMSANGVFREEVLVSLVKRTGADIMSAATGVTIILTTTGYFLRPFKGHAEARPGRIAAIWVGMTLAFEFIFGPYVDGKSWSTLVNNYALWDGKLWPLVLLSIAAAPFIWLPGESRGANRKNA